MCSYELSNILRKVSFLQINHKIIIKLENFENLLFVNSCYNELIDKDVCNEFSFLCKFDKICINLASECNGKFDCFDQTDEANCTEIFSLSHPYSKIQINPLFMCDYVQHYSNGEDEDFCCMNFISLYQYNKIDSLFSILS